MKQKERKLSELVVWLEVIAERIEVVGVARIANDVREVSRELREAIAQTLVEQADATPVEGSDDT